MSAPRTNIRKPIVLAPNEGRAYPMGHINAVFKADGAESNLKYSVSEWWLEPHTQGPGAHSHPEDDLFYVLEGTMSIFVEDHWVDAIQGAFIMIPGGLKHDFENRGEFRAGILNFSTPGGFESDMPSIKMWFSQYPPGAA